MDLEPYGKWDASGEQRPLLEVKDKIAICAGFIVAIILFFEDKSSPIVVGILIFALWLCVLYVGWHITYKITRWRTKIETWRDWRFGVSMAIVAALLTTFVGWYGIKKWPQRKYLIEVVFKQSPLWTKKRKSIYMDALDDYYTYLRYCGFSFPKELPPIGFIHSNMNLAGGSPNTPAYLSQILLSDEMDDNPAIGVGVYSNFVFNNALDSWNPSLPDHAAREAASNIASCYFHSSFANQNLCPSGWPDQKWIDALWDVRQTCHQDYADKLVFYTIQTWNSFPVNTPDFDSVFSNRLLAGESVVVSPGEKQCGFQDILPKHGIKPRL